MVALAGLALLLRPDMSEACSCYPTTVHISANWSHAVFLGEAISQRPEGKQGARVVDRRVVTVFRVVRAWKGVPNGALVEVHFGTDGAMCGTGFPLHGRRLVFGSLDRKGKLGTSLCAYAFGLSQAEAIAQLDSLKGAGALRAGSVADDESRP